MEGTVAKTKAKHDGKTHSMHRWCEGMSFCAVIELRALHGWVPIEFQLSPSAELHDP